MKKSLIILGLITSSLFSQNHIEIIEHGEQYDKLKNMSHYDLEDSYKDNYHRLNHYLKNVEATNSYAYSTFISKFKHLCSQNSRYGKGIYKLQDDFENEVIDKLVKNIPKTKTSNNTFTYGIMYFFSEEHFSKNSSAYLKALLEKYEIICKYYANKYNYQIDKYLQESEIEQYNKQLDISINNSQKSEKLMINNNQRLKEIRQSEKDEISKINIKFDAKINTLLLNEKEKLKKLAPENFRLNSSKIKTETNDLKKLEILKKNKEIKNIKNKFSSIKNEEISKIKKAIAKNYKDSSIIAENKKSDVRQSIESKYNLNKIRESFEINYENEINIIDVKIENILIKESQNDKKTVKKMKKVLGKFF